MRHTTFSRTPPDSPTSSSPRSPNNPALSTPSGEAVFNGNGSPSKHISQLMELNCSVGKGRRKINNNNNTMNNSSLLESSASMPSLSQNHHQRETNIRSRSKVDERVSANGGNREPFLIGVAGGTASGKSTVCNLIMNSLPKRNEWFC